MMDSMLRLLLESSVTMASRPRDPATANAVLHTFLLATRNLCHFLYSHKPRPLDIIAEDFFDRDEDWRNVRPPAVPEFLDGSLVDLISKRLAHLTWDRASGTKPSWGAFRIAWELGKALEVFVATAPSTRIAPVLTQDIAAMVKLMHNIVHRFGGVDGVQLAPLSQLLDGSDRQ